MARLAPLLVVLGLALVPGATASIWIVDNPQKPALKVNAAGFAQVSWSAGGVRKTQLVPPTGRVLPGGKAKGSDVSHKVTAGPALPLLVTLRQTPDRRYWALQAWQPKPSGPTQLQFSRWSGDPTQLTLIATPSKDTEILSGTATFAGKPVTGYTVTTAGTRMRIYVYLECFGCGGATGWKPMLGVAPRADGTFRVFIRSDWRGTKYRATVAGPNSGATMAPIAQAETASSL